MKKKLLHIISTISLALVMFVLPCMATLLDSEQTKDYTQITRTIETSNELVDYESILNEFEDSKLETEGLLTTFEGTQTIRLTDLEGLDEVSKEELKDEELSIKYNFSYDYETNLVTLTAILVGDSVEEPMIDTIVGAAFVNEAGNIDAVLDIDGEYVLLSELQDAGMVQNCGWFKNLFKKVTNTVKKATNTLVGVVGAVATVVVPAAIGVAFAATGVGLAATIAMGAVAGATIAGATTAASTAQQNNGKVDWEAVGICAGIGGAVGALASAATYKLTKFIGSKLNNYGWGDKSTLDDHFNRHGSDFNCKNKQEYAKKANDFYNNRGQYQIKTDSNGITRVYDSSTNTFGSYNADGTTKTFFKPSQGQIYFNNQPGV